MNQFPVAMDDRWFPGPVSHPYPGVSSCRTDPAFQGDPRLPVVGWTLLLLPVTSWLYATFAVLAGGWFLFYAHSLQAAVRRGEETKPMSLFHRSNTYLMIVFVALAVDSAIGLPTLGLPF